MKKLWIETMKKLWIEVEISQDDVKAFKATQKQDSMSGGKVYGAMRQELSALVAAWIASWHLNPPPPTVEELIDELRAEEGASVIICDNPDFNDQPDRTVEVVAPWNKFIGTTYGGETLLEALQAAVEAKRKATKKE